MRRGFGNGFLLFCFLLPLTTVAAPASTGIEGRWLLDFDGQDPGRVQLTMQRRTAQGSWNNSSTYALSALHGLSRPAGAAEVPAHFEIARDAGHLVFDGHVNESGGAGHFLFLRSGEFAGVLKGFGYAEPTEDQLYSMTL